MAVCLPKASASVPWSPAVMSTMFFRVRLPSGSPFAETKSDVPTFTLTSAASMVAFASASPLMSAFTVKRLSPSASSTGSLRVKVSSAAAAASASFVVSFFQRLTLVMLASVPFRLSFRLLMVSAFRLPSVFTFTDSRSWLAAPMEASAVVACAASTATTSMFFT